MKKEVKLVLGILDTITVELKNSTHAVGIVESG